MALFFAVLCLAVGSALATYTCPPPGIPPFQCNYVLPPPTPTSVRQLHPGHIKAVMAMGDSITAGFAMKDGPMEYRGLVYSIGGDEYAITLGNFLAFYNPSIKGRAIGATIPESHVGRGLNTAVSGAVVADIPGQTDELIKKLNDIEYRDILDEWKLLTLFIGANDICGCHHTTPEQFEEQLTTALTKIRAEIPKVFVNIITIFNISQVWDASIGDAYCEVVVPTLHECECLDSNATDRLRMDELGLQINNVTRTVAAQFAAYNDWNFTISVQPGVENMNVAALGKLAEDFLSDVDCFHPSLCTDQGFALSFWNNMFQAPGNKSTQFDPHSPPPIYCPTSDDVIQ